MCECGFPLKLIPVIIGWSNGEASCERSLGWLWWPGGPLAKPKIDLSADYPSRRFFGSKLNFQVSSNTSSCHKHDSLWTRRWLFWMRPARSQANTKRPAFKLYFSFERVSDILGWCQEGWFETRRKYRGGSCKRPKIYQSLDSKRELLSMSKLSALGR